MIAFNLGCAGPVQFSSALGPKPDTVYYSIASVLRVLKAGVRFSSSVNVKRAHPPCFPTSDAKYRPCVLLIHSYNECGPKVFGVAL